MPETCEICEDEDATWRDEYAQWLCDECHFTEQDEGLQV